MLTAESRAALRHLVDVAPAARVDAIAGHELQQPAQLVDQLGASSANGRERPQQSGAGAHARRAPELARERRPAPLPPSQERT
ncbi:hypothetical protein [Gryllotalpicola protaetiae]|nr:hypothetical protein [Gryllotalpicola protaetiae]